MNKFYLTLVIILFINSNIFSQRKKPNLDNQKQDEQKTANETYGSNDSWKDKMMYGGVIGGGFSNVSSFFLIQPIVGYKFTDKIQAGLSPLYIYSSRTFQLTNGGTKDLSMNAYGPGIFGRYFINDNIFAHTEYQGIKHTYLNEFDGSEISMFSNSIFVGGGYSPGGSGVFFVALYDLIYDANTSFYRSPIDVRIGFTF